MTFEQVERNKDRIVDIIYCSANGEFTQRRIKVVGVTKQQLYGYCYLRRQSRTFLIDRVLAWQPASV
ncbi:transcriptional regulator [Aquibacillus koreensis]|uniref:Transcriptional regulator n=1 Tax=Aquibacillus koreensis TaxID=279446 RepID=A0A9X4AKG8_9BACI|nr:transcriptional regulator [Aquibacillus koreensis]MCT2535049.1 transcriptional regulator [Aquibacillus koreensis]MDC3422829.1 transcriptional regulator [Aquibacillus koreensis]